MGLHNLYIQISQSVIARSETTKQSRLYEMRLPRSPAKAGWLAMTMQKYLMLLYLNSYWMILQSPIFNPKSEMNLAESWSKKSVAFSCLLKIVAGQAVVTGPSKVFLTASAFVIAGTMQ